MMEFIQLLSEVEYEFFLLCGDDQEWCAQGAPSWESYWENYLTRHKDCLDFLYD